VCGDDRVRGTWEQILLMQVAQVTLSCREGLDVGENAYVSLLPLKTVVNPDGKFYDVLFWYS